MPQCDAWGPVFTGKLWVARVSFVVYIMGIQSVMGECTRQQLYYRPAYNTRVVWRQSTADSGCSGLFSNSMHTSRCCSRHHAAAGWTLFLVFAGWGMFAAPIDWIFQYMRRPKSVITKSEYIERARGLAQRAKEIKVSCCLGNNCSVTTDGVQCGLICNRWPPADMCRFCSSAPRQAA